ncbi:hypothetical protein IAW_05897 [Bacillus cereus str. Schrouff]|uniref:hypothetical protein n=1 Tax=Bacillus cereus TaxID=1396 RepID=UPI00032E9416|nr:hypothetical protein [Bacillus cereus]EOO04890.1 hypothetical protein IAW_05897 [Bacillus cereus str. Schrouff]EOO81070.1 hypothetical protein IGY_06082 [Bacillus cereus K-5975c]
MNNYYNPYYYPNNYYDPYRQGPGTHSYQPPAVGSEWINQNVDIMMTNGKCFSNVRFLSVDSIPGIAPGEPTEYVWTFEVYPPGGGAPTRRRVSHKDVAEINQAGSLCQGTGTGTGMGTGTGTGTGMGTGTGTGTSTGTAFCKQWTQDPYTGHFFCSKW